MALIIVITLRDLSVKYFCNLRKFFPASYDYILNIFGVFWWFHLVVGVLFCNGIKSSLHDRVWHPFYYSTVRWNFLSFAYKNIKSLKCRWWLWISSQTDVYEKLPGKASEFKCKIVQSEAASASQLHIRELPLGKSESCCLSHEGMTWSIEF